MKRVILKILYTIVNGINILKATKHQYGHIYEIYLDIMPDLILKQYQKVVPDDSCVSNVYNVGM